MIFGGFSSFFPRPLNSHVARRNDENVKFITAVEIETSETRKSGRAGSILKNNMCSVGSISPGYDPVPMLPSEGTQQHQAMLQRTRNTSLGAGRGLGQGAAEIGR